MSEIYEPAEDSYLLRDVLEKHLQKNKIRNVLEIGIGSGIQLETLKEFKIRDIFGVDINKDAVKHCKKLGFNCKTSNLFSNVKGKFDLIIFNPPYLPEDNLEPKNSKIATTGGKKGSELINKFLNQSPKFLNNE